MLCLSFSPIKLQEELPEGIKAAVGTCIHFKSSPMHFASIMELIYFWNYILCFGLYKTCVTGLKIQCTCNGQSMDNVWTDWGVCQSTFCLTGLVDQSHSIILKKKKKRNFPAAQLFHYPLYVCSEFLCIAELWSEFLGEMHLEPLFTIHTLKQTSGLMQFQSKK